jgi:hypothetical protein
LINSILLVQAIFSRVKAIAIGNDQILGMTFPDGKLLPTTHYPDEITKRGFIEAWGGVK